MVELNIKLDESRLPEWMRTGARIPDKIFDNALKHAAMKGINKARTETKKEVADLYTLPSSVVHKTSDTKYSGDGALMNLDKVGNMFTDFKGVKTKKTALGASGRNLYPTIVEIKQGNTFSHDRILAGTMQKNQKKIGVYKKDANRRNVFRRYFGASTRGIFNANENVTKPVVDAAMNMFYKEFERLVERDLFK